MSRVATAIASTMLFALSSATASAQVLSESEPNSTTAQATLITANPAKIKSNIYPNADVDYFKFTATAGSRLYAATMTAFSASGSNDSMMALSGPGTSETDDEDGSWGVGAS